MFCIISLIRNFYDPFFCIQFLYLNWFRTKNFLHTKFLWFCSQILKTFFTQTFNNFAPKFFRIPNFVASNIFNVRIWLCCWKGLFPIFVFGRMSGKRYLWYSISEFYKYILIYLYCLINKQQKLVMSALIWKKTSSWKFTSKDLAVYIQNKT